MPPKTSQKSLPTDPKSASIPTRVKDVTKMNPNAVTPVNGASGSGGRPDKAAYEREQTSLKVEIDTLQAKVTAIRAQIGDPKGGAGGNPLQERRKKLRNEMDSLREEQSKGKSSRGKLLDQIKAGNESVQRKIKELNTSRGKLPYKSSAEVEAKIRQLDSQIESGTMRIVDEKKALAEIQNLKKQRKLVDAFGPQQEAIEAEKAKVENLRKLLDDPENKNVNDRWAAIKEELDQINAKLNEANKGRDKLFEERNQLQDTLTELFTKKRESATRYKEANDKYYAKMQEDRQRRIERQKTEREALEASELKDIHNEMREEASAPAYEREIEDCRTLILYFDKLIGNAGNSDQPIEAPVFGKTSSVALPKLGDVRKVEEADAFQGMVAVKKKGSEQEEEFFMGGGNKKGKKNKKSPPESTAAPATQALQLPLSTLNALHALAISVPMTRDDVAATITSLSEKKKWFTDNQERVTKERIADVEAKIAAAEAKLKAKLEAKAKAENNGSDDKEVNGATEASSPEA
ncbi:uncharacterized protein MELLADRAFT_43674 [Melampsora larici-populina 98AG31]|uniref:Nuclear segregation protein Bfr1 n=1 Tax=Melampsora larici-populina (strain 98AG31 / pathotype 3-4-7) TaxID=747676 RepID=F4RNS5_MELLP|nr:uncharacterized protein MELLADRAFT_43674 [Melampsora larici-populina 98AG31]EGG06035.1 hypothetical protein MELLADRAFT_43674 [Melampsora larici-populina 98AG31]